MSKYHTPNDDILVKNKIMTNGSARKDLAEDFLAEKGYERQIKPRGVNGGRDRLPQNHTAVNKERLNTSLAKTPRQLRETDLSKKRERGVSARPEVRTESAKTPFPIPYMICIVLLTAIFLYVIHLYIEIDELDDALTDYNNMLVEMKKEETDLKIKKNNMYDLEEIERIAREEYGMVNRDQLPKEYITPDSKDDIEIIDMQSEEVAPGALMSGFAKSISNLLSYIN